MPQGFVEESLNGMRLLVDQFGFCRIGLQFRFCRIGFVELVFYCFCPYFHQLFFVGFYLSFYQNLTTLWLESLTGCYIQHILWVNDGAYPADWSWDSFSKFGLKRRSRGTGSFSLSSFVQEKSRRGVVFRHFLNMQSKICIIFYFLFAYSLHPHLLLLFLSASRSLPRRTWLAVIVYCYFFNQRHEAWIDTLDCLCCIACIT